MLMRASAGPNSCSSRRRLFKSNNCVETYESKAFFEVFKSDSSYVRDILQRVAESSMPLKCCHAFFPTGLCLFEMKCCIHGNEYHQATADLSLCAAMRIIASKLSGSSSRQYPSDLSALKCQSGLCSEQAALPRPKGVAKDWTISSEREPSCVLYHNFQRS